MMFYDVSRPLYLETEASGVNLGAVLLHVRKGMNCGHYRVSDNATLCPITYTSNTLLSTEWWYSNIKWEALGILHGLKEFTITVLPRKYV